jgi:hypothetical protein
MSSNFKKKESILVSIDEETFIEKHLADQHSESSFEKDILALLNFCQKVAARFLIYLL